MFELALKEVDQILAVKVWIVFILIVNTGLPVMLLCSKPLCLLDALFLEIKLFGFEFELLDDLLAVEGSLTELFLNRLVDADVTL